MSLCCSPLQILPRHSVDPGKAGIREHILRRRLCVNYIVYLETGLITNRDKDAEMRWRDVTESARLGDHSKAEQQNRGGVEAAGGRS